MKEEPSELAIEEPEGEEEEEEQEAATGGGEEEAEPESGARARRTAKTRAPKRSDTAPASRRKASKRRRDPRQFSLFSRLSPDGTSSKAYSPGGSILILLLGTAGLVILFHFFAGSRFFALRGVDVQWPAVKPDGRPLLTAGEVEAMVRLNVASGVLNADLDKIRKELEKYPLIREAEVARLLPDRLRVSIVERQPVALARRGGAGADDQSSVVCVDDEGVMFGDSSYWRVRPWPPLISGLAESGEDAREINRQWIMTYKRLMADLDQTEPPLSSRIDQVIFDKDLGVRLRLADKRESVLVGREDFRIRLNVALDILAAVNRKDLEALNVLRISDAERLLNGTINYLNVTDPKRPIVGLDE